MPMRTQRDDEGSIFQADVRQCAPHRVPVLCAASDVNAILVKMVVSARCHARSEVMNPTFCMYDDLYFQKRLRIESISVEKARRSFEEKKRWALDALWGERQSEKLLMSVTFRCSNTVSLFAIPNWQKRMFPFIPKPR